MLCADGSNVQEGVMHRYSDDGYSGWFARCVACAKGRYALQAGSGKGPEKLLPVNCLPCVFGGECLGGAEIRPVSGYFGLVSRICLSPFRLPICLQVTSNALQFRSCPSDYCDGPTQQRLTGTDSVSRCRDGRQGLLSILKQCNLRP